MSSLTHRLIAVFSALAICLTVFCAVPSSAEENNSNQQVKSITLTKKDNYKEYSQSNENYTSAKRGIGINVNGADFSKNSGVGTVGDYLTEKDVLICKNVNGSVSYNIVAPKTEKYNLLLRYAILDDNATDLQLGIKIDGKYPFSEAEEFTFPQFWENSVKDWAKDSKGNDLTPEQSRYKGIVEYFAKDNNGIILKPYEFLLTAGKHTLTIETKGQSFVLADINLLPPEETVNYAKPDLYSKDNSQSNIQNILLQGEKANLKTSSALIPKSDNTDGDLTPASATRINLNYIGGSSWKQPNQSLIWDFEVKEAGYYKLGFNFKQDQIINGETYRWLKIDGKTPFAEAQKITFGYSSKWQFKTFANEKEEPYLIWLDKGVHTFSLETTLGSIAPYYERLSKVTKILGDTYTDIIMITGDTPDPNRDYELFKSIPDFEKTLKTAQNDLDQLITELQKLTGKKSTQYIASIQNMVRVIKIMLERPFIAHQYLNDYYSNYCSVSAWLNDMSSMPLALDEIQIIHSGNDFNKKDSGFFKNLKFGIKRFLNSFMQEYSTPDSRGEKQKLRLWVNWGRDQTRVLSSLIQDSFTPESGIEVRVEMVNASLVQGIMSGNAPDLAIQCSRAEPVNLGMRNALYDLKNFKDYGDVLKRFQEGAETPYCYDGKCYALPDTQTFFAMFYRKDILEQLELDVPRTWQEYIHASTIIQRSNMQVYLPYTRIVSSTIVNTGVGSLNLYPTLMMQNGLSLYNEDKTATAMASEKAVSVFDDWTELYTDYQILKEADFYNRFRTGSMPLGIAPYTTYYTLTQTASEIKGRWAVSVVPTVEGKEPLVAGGGTGCAILSCSDKKEQAWEFLKWWTSADTQKRYSQNIESVLGLVGRIATSNIEALKNLSFEKDDLEQLLKQWSYVKEVPEIPGSYYLSRSLDQAYWAVLNKESISMDAVSKWSDIANKEIARKIKEYKALGVRTK